MLCWPWLDRPGGCTHVCLSTADAVWRSLTPSHARHQVTLKLSSGKCSEGSTGCCCRPVMMAHHTPAQVRLTLQQLLLQILFAAAPDPCAAAVSYGLCCTGQRQWRWLRLKQTQHGVRPVLSAQAAASGHPSLPACCAEPAQAAKSKIACLLPFPSMRTVFAVAHVESARQ